MDEQNLHKLDVSTEAPLKGGQLERLTFQTDANQNLRKLHSSTTETALKPTKPRRPTFQTDDQNLVASTTKTALEPAKPQRPTFQSTDDDQQNLLLLQLKLDASLEASLLRASQQATYHLDRHDGHELHLTAQQKAVKAKHPPIRKQYEYLDHTADVQIHAWGQSLEEAFAQSAMAMFGYMTDTETVEPRETLELESQGEDLESLLYHFLDDWLFAFGAEPYFVPREVRVVQLDRAAFRVRSVGRGDRFSLSKHPQGSEVKAITYSAMQIHHKQERTEIFAIIDI